MGRLIPHTSKARILFTATRLRLLLDSIELTQPYAELVQRYEVAHMIRSIQDNYSRIQACINHYFQDPRVPQ